VGIGQEAPDDGPGKRHVGPDADLAPVPDIGRLEKAGMVDIFRALWRWPASMRTVFRGAPGRGAARTAVGTLRTRKTVT